MIKKIPTRRLMHYLTFRFWQALADYPALPYLIALAGLLIVNS